MWASVWFASPEWIQRKAFKHPYLYSIGMCNVGMDQSKNKIKSTAHSARDYFHFKLKFYRWRGWPRVRESVYVLLKRKRIHDTQWAQMEMCKFALAYASGPGNIPGTWNATDFSVRTNFWPQICPSFCSVRFEVFPDSVVAVRWPGPKIGYQL